MLVFLLSFLTVFFYIDLNMETKYAPQSAIHKAGTLAGLKILRMLPEPTAASVAYGIHHEIGPERKILVYDHASHRSSTSFISIL